MTPDDPRHGKRSGRMAHHRAGEKPCEPCALAHNRYLKEYRNRTKGGTLHIRRPASEAVALLDLANRVGITDHALAKAAGLGSGRVSRLRSEYRHVDPRTLHKLQQAIKDLRVAPTALIPAGLTQERLKSMMAQGWSLGWIRSQIDWCPQTAWVQAPRVQVATATKVRDLALRVGDSRGPSYLAAALAAKQGWQVAAAWDDPGTLTWPLNWEAAA